jgi:hypothetical protein
MSARAAKLALPPPPRIRLKCGLNAPVPSPSMTATMWLKYPGTARSKWPVTIDIAEPHRKGSVDRRRLDVCREMTQTIAEKDRHVVLYRVRNDEVELAILVDVRSGDVRGSAHASNSVRGPKIPYQFPEESRFLFACVVPTGEVQVTIAVEIPHTETGREECRRDSSCSKNTRRHRH